MDLRRNPSSTFRWISLIAGVVLVALVAVWVILRPPSEPGTDNPEIVPTSTHTAKWLLDPFSTDIEKWQLLRAPRDIVEGPGGSLIISDTGNSRVLQISSDGNLIAIVGGSGSGPGEFRAPWDLEYVRAGNILWIVDRRLMRVSRFEFNSGRWDFIDSFGAPQVVRQSPRSLVVIGRDRFIFSDSSAAKRMQVINGEGETTKAFGDLWIPEGLVNASLRLWNTGQVVSGGDKSVLFAWSSRPLVELWSIEGQQLASMALNFGEYPELFSDMDPNESRPSYVLAVCTDASREHLYILVPKRSPLVRLVVYESDLRTLTVSRRLEIEFESNTPVVAFSTAVIRDRGIQRLYGADFMSGGVFCFEFPDLKE